MGVISRQVFPVCESLCFFCPALRARSRHPVKRYKKLLAEIFPRSPVNFFIHLHFFFFFFGVYELMSNVGSGNSQQKLIFMLQSEKKSQLYTEAMWELLVLVFGDLVKIGLKFDLC